MDSNRSIKKLAQHRVSRRKTGINSFNRIVKRNLHARDIIEGKDDLAATMDVGLTTIERWIRTGMPIISKQPWRFSRRQVIAWKNTNKSD